MTIPISLRTRKISAISVIPWRGGGKRLVLCGFIGSIRPERIPHFLLKNKLIPSAGFFLRLRFFYLKIDVCIIEPSDNSAVDGSPLVEDPLLSSRRQDPDIGRKKKDHPK